VVNLTGRHNKTKTTGNKGLQVSRQGPLQAKEGQKYPKREGSPWPQHASISQCAGEWLPVQPIGTRTQETERGANATTEGEKEKSERESNEQVKRRGGREKGFQIKPRTLKTAVGRVACQDRRGHETLEKKKGVPRSGKPDIETSKKKVRRRRGRKGHHIIYNTTGKILWGGHAEAVRITLRHGKGRTVAAALGKSLLRKTGKKHGSGTLTWPYNQKMCRSQRLKQGRRVWLWAWNQLFGDLRWKEGGVASTRGAGFSWLGSSSVSEKGSRQKFNSGEPAG